MQVFCEECRDYISYDIKEINRSKEIKDKKIDFKEKIAYCVKCNSEVFISELRDENLAVLEDAYRKA